MLDVLDRDRVGAIVLASGTSVIVAAGTGVVDGAPMTEATVIVARAAGTGIVDGTAPMTEAAVARAGGTTTATHAMSVVTALRVAARVLAHGIVSDTIMGWRDRSAMSPRTPAGADAVATGDRVRRETASSSTSRLPKAGRRARSAP